MMTFNTISKTYPLVLASASPRRRQLLTQIGLPFRSEKSDVVEQVAAGDPAQAASKIAEEKARRVHSEVGEGWTLGADTIVVYDSMILGKPQDEYAAIDMLRLLSSKKHRVITGFCILDPSGKSVHLEAVTTVVTFKVLSDHEIMSYIKTNEPFGKAGSYAIQGIGAFMVESISGSHSNVVGLPLCALTKALISVNALNNFPFYS